MIYLDNAATTRPKPPSVAEAVAAAMNDYGNSGRGTHPEALEAARSIYGVRQALAALFGCSRADRVAFTPNSTMALNIAISGLLGAGDHVISTDLEHNSVLRPLYRLRAQGGAVDFVPADRQGRIDYEDFERLLRPNTKAVVCTHGSNLTGDLMDIQRVGNFCQKHRLLFILDASQTAGVFPIDMERQHISVVCFTGHKSLMGPQGTGGLCVGAGVEIRPFAVGGTGVQSYSETQPEAYPTRLEAGTLNSHGIAGLGASLAFLKRTGWDAVRMHESVLSRRFYETVRTIPGVKVYGNFAVQLRAPIVSLNIADLDSSEVADEARRPLRPPAPPGAGDRGPGRGAVLLVLFQYRGRDRRGCRGGPYPGGGGSLTMRKKEERFVVTFATTTGAMAMERACQAAGLPGRLIPVPRSITAGCGMCWSAPPSARADLEALVIRERLDVDGLYAVLL